MSKSLLSFLAFANDAADQATLKAFAASRGWAEDCVYQGDIRTATEFLKGNGSPTLLLVEIPSAAEAPALLDGLAEACDPDTKVIVIGSVNEYSFFCWLMELGISSYLLKPLTQAALDGAWAKSVALPPGAAAPEKPPATLIAVMGSRGGVGASSIAINLAGIIADVSGKNVALIDLDPQEGSIALTLDLEPSRGFREALEKPDRIDSLFVERVMTKPHKHLAILSAEESLQERLPVHDEASEALLKEIRSKFDVVVLDVPRYLNPFTRKCLNMADHVLLVTELTLVSLRDTLRLADLMRESLKMKPPVVIANRKGLAAKHELKQGDFEKGINAKVDYIVPFTPDVFMPVGPEILAIKFKTSPAFKPLYDLAGELVPEAKGKMIAKVKGGLLGKKKEPVEEKKKE